MAAVVCEENDEGGEKDVGALKLVAALEGLLADPKETKFCDEASELIWLCWFTWVA